MGITGINDITSVWLNDGHRVASFCLILIGLYFISLNIKYRKIFFRSSIAVSVLFLLNIAIFIVGVVGIGELIIIPMADSIVRSIGLFIVIITIFMKTYFYKKHNQFLSSSEDFCKNGFYRYVRNPNSFMDFVLLIGLGLSVVSPFSIGFTLIAYLPSTLVFINIKENRLIKIDENYIDYMVDVNKFIPNLKMLLKVFF